MARSLRPVLALLALALAGCGGSPEPAAAPAAPAEELFTVRPEGPAGPLLGYDARTRTRRFSLPPGAASADGRRFYAAVGTDVHVYAPATGALLERRALGPGWSVGGVSPSGRWLALADEDPGATRIRLLDTRGWRRVHELRLSGRFEVDAVAADGSALFLIQHVTDENYLVWLYDLGTGRLSQPGTTQPKARPQLMTGYAWGGVASPDGRWLLTLYLNTQRSVAFVHALDVERRRPLCIDLPSASGRLETLERYSLALAPNGRRLLAPNPALGLVAEVDLTQLKVVRTGELAAGPAGRGAVSAVAPDGTLFVASGRSVWRYGAGRAARAPWDAGGAVAGLAVGRDGSRVYVVRADERVLVLNARTGGAA